MTAAVIGVVLLLGLAAVVYARRTSRRLAAAVLPARGGELALSPDEARTFEARAPMFGGSGQHAGLLPSMVLEVRGPLPPLRPTPAPTADTGRHRRPDGELPPGALGMTGIMRKLDAAAIAADARLRAAVDAETGRIPRVRD